MTLSITVGLWQDTVPTPFGMVWVKDFKQPRVRLR